MSKIILLFFNIPSLIYLSPPAFLQKCDGQRNF